MELKIRNFGPIKEADIDFGHLTFLIGPQASGKSLSLELLKLIIDKQHIISTLRNYNYILSKTDARNLLEWYFGEGLSDYSRKRPKYHGLETCSLLRICLRQLPDKRLLKYKRNQYSMYRLKEY